MESFFIETADFQKVKDQCLQAPNQTLFIFDIDLTLIHYTDPALHPSVLLSFESFTGTLSFEDYILLNSIIAAEAIPTALDQGSALFLQYLIQCGQKVIMLTKAGTGAIHTFKVFEYKRLEI